VDAEGYAQAVQGQGCEDSSAERQVPAVVCGGD